MSNERTTRYYLLSVTGEPHVATVSNAAGGSDPDLRGDAEVTLGQLPSGHDGWPVIYSERRRRDGSTLTIRAERRL